MESIICTLVTLAPHTRIAHHQPGRIRLKISPSAFKIVDTANIESMVESIPGVLDYRVNLWAKSIVIDYDRKRLPYELWVLLGEMGGRPELESELTARLRALWTQQA